MLSAVFKERNSGVLVKVNFSDAYPSDKCADGQTVIPILPGTYSFTMLHKDNISICIKHKNKVFSYIKGCAPRLIRNKLNKPEYKIYGYMLLEELTEATIDKKVDLCQGHNQYKENETNHTGFWGLKIIAACLEIMRRVQLA